MENYQRAQAKEILAFSDAIALGSGTLPEDSRREVHKNYQEAAESPRMREKRLKKEAERHQQGYTWTIGLF